MRMSEKLSDRLSDEAFCSAVELDCKLCFDHLILPFKLLIELTNVIYSITSGGNKIF